MADRGRRAARAHRRLQGAGGRGGAPRSRTARPGFGMLLDGTYGREALFRAADHRSGSAVRSSEPGSRPLEFEAERSRLAARRMAGRRTRSSACASITRTIRRTLKARQERELLRSTTPRARLGRELLVEIIAGKHGPLGPTTRSRRVLRAALRPRHQAGLVEARAAGRRAPPGGHRRGDPRQRPVLPRHRAARPRSAARTCWRPAFAVAATRAARQGLRGRPHDLRRGRQRSGCAARSTTRRRSPTWRARFARLVDAWRRANAALPRAA